MPSGDLPKANKKYNPDSAKFAIINLQPTKHDKKADLVIHSYADSVCEKLMRELGEEIPEYSEEEDLVKRVRNGEMGGRNFLEWTQDEEEAKRVKKIADKMDDEWKRRRKEEREQNKKRKSEAAVEKAQKKAVKLEEDFSENGEVETGGKCVKQHASVKLEDFKGLAENGSPKEEDNSVQQDDSGRLLENERVEKEESFYEEDADKLGGAKGLAENETLKQENGVKLEAEDGLKESDAT